MLAQKQPQWIADNGIWRKPGEGPGYRTTPVIDEHRDLYPRPMYDRPPPGQEPRRMAREFRDEGYDTAFLTDRERRDRSVEVRDGRLYRNAIGEYGDIGNAGPLDTRGAMGMNPNAKDKHIWVMDQDGKLTTVDAAAEMHRLSPSTQFYYHGHPQCPALPFWSGDDFRRIHHTSLAQGEDVAAAGEMRVEDGVLTSFSNLSGHYRPSPGHAAQAIRELHRRGVDIEDPRLKIELSGPLSDGRKMELDLKRGQGAQLLGYSPRDKFVLEQILGNNRNKSQAMQELSGVAAQAGMMEDGQLIPSRIRGARLPSQQVPATPPPAQHAQPAGESLYGPLPHRFGQSQNDSLYGPVPHRFGQSQNDSLYGPLPHRFGQSQNDSLYGPVPHRFGQSQNDSLYGPLPHRFGQSQSESLYGPLPHRFGQSQNDSLYGPLPHRFGQPEPERVTLPGAGRGGDGTAAAHGLGDAPMPAMGAGPSSGAAAGIIPPGRVQELIRLFEGQY